MIRKIAKNKKIYNTGGSLVVGNLVGCAIVVLCMLVVSPRAAMAAYEGVPPIWSFGSFFCISRSVVSTVRPNSVAPRAAVLVLSTVWVVLASRVVEFFFHIQTLQPPG